MEVAGGLGCIGVLVLLSLAGGVFWLWMLIECLTKEPSEGNDKLVWGLVIFLGSFPGALLYYFLRRNERIDRFGE
ncbi:PLD nuclease N-terminal domain-containing protein [Aeoliella sp.]|uniref:PLD nuclease N-terminal domain-containing protein n=1 Tax=Aeoliella sp. TaxID=2795800 RepID=UPI003CCBC427